MEKRFGITKRSKVSNKPEKIELHFSRITGSFIEKFSWHNSQNIRKVDNHYRVEFESEINRELVGWIFQWMNNVKIIKPKELQELYDDILKDIQENKQKLIVPNKNIFNAQDS